MIRQCIRAVKLIVSISAAWLTACLVYAHEGHDHGPATAELPRTIAARTEAASDDFELVAVRDGTRVVIYLDSFKTNAPVQDATIDIESGDSKATAKHVKDGVYEADVPWLGKAGRHDLQIAIQTPRDADLLSVRFEVSPPQVDQHGHHDHAREWLIGGAAALLVLVLLVVIHRARRRAQRALALATAIALTAAIDIEGAHANGATTQPKKDSASVATVPVGSEPASRLPDGSVFMSKASQRLFGVRTAVAAALEEPRAIELNGQVVIDPNAGGQVHAPIAGRVVPGPGGLPRLGASIARGQTLAWLDPTTGALERAGTQAQLAELAGQLAIVEARLKRYEQLDGSIPKKEIDTSKAEAQALRGRQAALSAALSAREALVAPVAGRVVAATALAGQVAAARELLFVIADPERLLIEALAYDPALAKALTTATALTATGTAVELTLIGAGMQLRNQALPLHFRVRPPAPALAIGQPVRLLAPSSERVRGMAVPPGAVVRNATGESIVWVHSGAERFTERRVRVENVRADIAIATAGVNAGDRVVTQGATALSQVR